MVGRRRKVRWDRVISCFLLMVIFIVTSWLTASYVDVVTHNLDDEPVYQEWNVFTKI